MCLRLWVNIHVDVLFTKPCFSDFVYLLFVFLCVGLFFCNVLFLLTISWRTFPCKRTWINLVLSKVCTLRAIVWLTYLLMEGHLGCCLFGAVTNNVAGPTCILTARGVGRAGRCGPKEDSGLRSVPAGVRVLGGSCARGSLAAAPLRIPDLSKPLPPGRGSLSRLACIFWRWVGWWGWNSGQRL